MASTATSGRSLSRVDQWLGAADSALRTLAAPTPGAASKPTPARTLPTLTRSEQQLSGALMRVNHVGEVCAQALYQAQALTARDPALRSHCEAAAREEADHLSWTHQRLVELQAHRSLLNPLWYAGAFGIGWVAGLAGDRVSLGFIVETERQVEAHLAGHNEHLPAADDASRAIVQQMKDDEARHAEEARTAGGVALPWPVRTAMRLAARVMTATAHRI